MRRYVMTARRKAALKKAQMASARKRRKNAPKRYSKRRGAYARKADKMSKSKRRVVRAAARATRGDGSNSPWTGSSVAYRISKRRGQKAGKIKKKRR